MKKGLDFLRIENKDVDQKSQKLVKDHINTFIKSADSIESFAEAFDKVKTSRGARDLLKLHVTM